MLKLSERFRVHKSNLFSCLDSSQKFDLIVANPPYIPQPKLASLQPEVRLWESSQALVSGHSGLDTLFDILRQSGRWMDPKAQLVVEFGDGQEEDVLAEAKRHFRSSQIRKDLFGRYRTLLCAEPRSK
mmetsp:Transcript_15634/g.33966  ORF Transcript_15634/g.33966 Transcript_15634/m.33966 type:complete len:128 (+) Transcript_15634:304-687(+)